MISKTKKILATTTLFGMISISAFVNHTQKEIEKNTEAAQMVETVVMSQCFESGVNKSEMDLKQTGGLSKDQVTQKVRGAKTTAELEMYRANNTTVGYTYRTAKRIWMNKKFHDGYSVCEKAKNLSHEISHKLSFAHDEKATKRRPYSVPYIIGAVVKKCCEEIK